jgi:hypothetical protein
MGRDRCLSWPIERKPPALDNHLSGVFQVKVLVQFLVHLHSAEDGHDYQLDFGDVLCLLLGLVVLFVLWPPWQSAFHL